MYNQYPMFGNYPYNPYGTMNMNMSNQNQKISLFKKGATSSFPKQKFNWNNFLNNTQRTLGIINQAIPIVYQVKPILSNAKTMFRIASAIEEVAAADTVATLEEDRTSSQNEQKNGSTPQFFL